MESTRGTVVGGGRGIQVSAEPAPSAGCVCFEAGDAHAPPITYMARAEAG